MLIDNKKLVFEYILHNPYCETNNIIDNIKPSRITILKYISIMLEEWIISFKSIYSKSSKLYWDMKNYTNYKKQYYINAEYINIYNDIEVKQELPWWNVNICASISPSNECSITLNNNILIVSINPTRIYFNWELYLPSKMKEKQKEYAKRNKKVSKNKRYLVPKWASDVYHDEAKNLEILSHDSIKKWK